MDFEISGNKISPGRAYANAGSAALGECAPTPTHADSIHGRIRGITERLGMTNNEIGSFADRWAGPIPEGDSSDKSLPNICGSYGEIIDALDWLDRMVRKIGDNAARLSSIA